LRSILIQTVDDANTISAEAQQKDEHEEMTHLPAAGCRTERLDRGGGDPGAGRHPGGEEQEKPDLKMKAALGILL